MKLRKGVETWFGLKLKKIQHRSRGRSRLPVLAAKTFKSIKFFDLAETPKTLAYPIIR
jgi:hypothetical protein